MRFFPDPEARWERRSPPTPLRDAVKERIGVTDEPLELLDGGRGNTNVRIGPDRVLRIYERDPSTVSKEAALLAKAWTSFCVPRVLSVGKDFLLLEHVAHDRLYAGLVQGRMVGTALAEIHSTRFPVAGFLGVELVVETPFGNSFDALRTHALSSLEAVDHEFRVQLERYLDEHEDRLRRELTGACLLHGDFKASNLHHLGTGDLLVLDWEFAYAGPPLMDIGQLLRWSPPAPFIRGFADAYVGAGGELPAGWRTCAEASDLFNLAGMLEGHEDHPRRSTAIRRRMQKTLASAR